MQPPNAVAIPMVLAFAAPSSRPRCSRGNPYFFWRDGASRPPGAVSHKDSPYRTVNQTEVPGFPPNPPPQGAENAGRAAVDQVDAQAAPGKPAQGKTKIVDDCD